MIILDTPANEHVPGRMAMYDNVFSTGPGGMFKDRGSCNLELVLAERTGTSWHFGLSVKTRNAIKAVWEEWFDGSIYSKASKKKPPIGLLGYKHWVSHRKLEILQAMERYAEAGEPIPVDWVKELQEHLEVLSGFSTTQRVSPGPL